MATRAMASRSARSAALMRRFATPPPCHVAWPGPARPGELPPSPFLHRPGARLTANTPAATRRAAAHGGRAWAQNRAEGGVRVTVEMNAGVTDGQPPGS